MAYDREGKPLNFVVTNGEIQLQPKVFAGLLQVGLQIHKEIDVPKGDAYLRTGIDDLGSNTAGTLGVLLRQAPTPTAAAKSSRANRVAPQTAKTNEKLLFLAS